MPRDGSGVFSKVAGTTAVSGTAIESAKYNSVIDDFAADANTPRPIVAGGTGASTAAAARTALGVQAADAGLTSIAGLTTAADKMIYTTAADTYAVTDLTAFARTLLDDANAAAMLSTLGVSAFAKTLLDDASAVAMRTTLGLDLATIEAADANNAAKSGFWRLQNTCVNLPASGTFDCIVTTTNGTDISQTATDAVTGASYRRVRTAGAWIAWAQFADANSIGTMIAPYLATTAAIQATTSGTAFDFTGIPAGVSQITVMFDGVTLSNTDLILVQIGDSGGIENTGYVSSSGDSASTNGSTSGFVVRRTAIPDKLSGSLILTRMDAGGTRWVQQHGMNLSSSSFASGGGSKTLSAMLDRLRVTRPGTDTFVAGAITIRYQ